MSSYVALLRGINVGGHTVPMATLTKTLEGIGCLNVKTILASGNVVFDTRTEPLPKLTKKLESALAERFGFPIPTLLRTKSEFEKLYTSQPFKGVRVTSESRLYVTFLPKKQRESSAPKLSSKGLRVVAMSGAEVCTVICLSDGQGTVGFMSALEKAYGKNITTRNWNTVVKIVAALGAPK